MKFMDIKKYEYTDFSVILFNGNSKWKENTYIIKKNENSEGYIIDPGFGCQHVVDYVTDNRLSIRSILLTHAHHDHLATASYISEKLDVPCIFHKDDYKLFMHAPMYSMRFAGEMVKRPKNTKFYNGDCEDELNLWGINLLHVPGHSHGGVCLFFKNIVFTGDTIIKEKLGRTDLPEGDRGELKKSVDCFFKVASEMKNLDIYPGHGENWTGRDFLEWWSVNNDSFQEHTTFEA